MNFEKYRGQWGGKIETGEEMWWTEPHHRVFFTNPIRNFLGRLRFRLDVRHFFLLRDLASILKKPFSKETKRSPVILDFGCGTGGITISFSKYLDLPICGMDIFPTQIKIANSQAQKFGSLARFEVLDSNGKIPHADGSVDAIVSGDVLGHVPSIPETLQDWARVLKPGGGVALFTEANYSDSDSSLMARLAKQGADMNATVPEHISLFSKEKLEQFFREAGFEVMERRSANLWHPFFFPHDYLQLFDRHPDQAFRNRWLRRGLRLWNRILKIIPFYPVPTECLRILLIRFFGARANGTSYYYLLTRK